MESLWNLIFEGKSTEALEMIEILTHYESPSKIRELVNHIQALDEINTSLIECSCLQLSLLNDMPEVTAALLEADADPNLLAEDEVILSPLEIAAMCTSFKMIQKLLNHGAKPSCGNSLTLAFKRRDYQSIIYLCKDEVRLKTQMVNIEQIRCVRLIKEARRFEKKLK